MQGYEFRIYNLLWTPYIQDHTHIKMTSILVKGYFPKYLHIISESYAY